MQIMPRCSLPGNVQDEVYRQVHTRALATVTWPLAQAVVEVLRVYVGRSRDERGSEPRCPAAPRSGTYTRQLGTPYGWMAELRVPTLRRGNRHREWQTIQRYDRCGGPWLAQPRLHDCWGPSLRALQEGRPLSLGAVFSLAACQRVVLGLEEWARACKTARLALPPPLGLVDGLWRKLAVPPGESRAESRGRQRAVQHTQPGVMLTAWGVWPAGHGEMLAWHLAASEAAASWGPWVGTLYTTGVTAQTTPLSVRDGSPGLDQALDSPLYGVPHQRCICHKIKNMTDHLHEGERGDEAGEPATPGSLQAKKERKRASLADASQLDATDVESAVRARAQGFRDPGAAREPQAVAAFFHDLEQTWCDLTVHVGRDPKFPVNT
jgi:putative transposase